MLQHQCVTKVPFPAVSHDERCSEDINPSQVPPVSSDIEVSLDAHAVISLSPVCFRFSLVRVMHHPTTTKGFTRYRPTRVRDCCDSCNNKRVKCSRTRPSCDRCSHHNRECVYGISRRAGRRRGSPGQQLTPIPPPCDSKTHHDAVTPTPPGQVGPGKPRNHAEYCACTKRYIEFMSRHPILTSSGANILVEDAISVSGQATHAVEMSTKCKGMEHGNSSFCLSSLLMREQLLNMYNMIGKVAEQTALPDDIAWNDHTSLDDALLPPSSGLASLSMDSEDSELALGDVVFRLEQNSSGVSLNSQDCDSPVTSGSRTPEIDSDAVQSTLEVLSRNMNILDQQMAKFQQGHAQQIRSITPLRMTERSWFRPMSLVPQTRSR